MASSSKNLIIIGAFVTELRRPKKTGFLIFLYCVLSRPGLVGGGRGRAGAGDITLDGLIFLVSEALFCFSSQFF